MFSFGIPSLLALLVMSLADFTDNDFVEKCAPHLQHCLNWVILTPPLSEDSKKKSFLDSYGNMISTGQGKVFRERGWWRSGQDKLASYATPLEGWDAKGQILDPDHTRCNAALCTLVLCARSGAHSALSAQ